VEGTQQSLFVQILLCGFGDKDVSFLWVQGGYIQNKGFMSCFWKEQKVGMKDLPASDVFSKAKVP
jgi:hypothetical protein